MNAEEFYEEFKHALKSLMVSWGDKKEAEVFFREEFLVLKNDGREFAFRIEKEEIAQIDGENQPIEIAESKVE